MTTFAGTGALSTGYLDTCAAVLDDGLGTVPAYETWRPHDPGPANPPLVRYAALPSLTKQHMRERGYEQFVSPGRDVRAALASGEISLAETSGSTSDRVTNIWCQEWWDASERASWRLSAHTRSLELGSHREAILTSALCTGDVCEDGYLGRQERVLDRFLFLNERSDPTTWTPAHMDRMVDEINEFEPVMIEANPSFLARLSRHIARSGRRVHAPGVIVFTYENPSLLHRRQIRGVFACPQISSYGSTEAGYVFMECEAGRLHQNTECCHIDFLPFAPEFGGPAVGRILVTTFGNPWRVLLRFDIGDLVRLETARCPCGRDEGLTLAGIEGRVVNLTCDTRGRPVTQAAVDRALDGMAGLDEYQLIQHDPSSYELRFVADAGALAHGPAACEAALHAVYGDHARITPTRLAAIAPDPPGKYRLTKAAFPIDVDTFVDQRFLPRKP